MTVNNQEKVKKSNEISLINSMTAFITSYNIPQSTKDVILTKQGRVDLEFLKNVLYIDVDTHIRGLAPLYRKKKDL